LVSNFVLIFNLTSFKSFKVMNVWIIFYIINFKMHTDIHLNDNEVEIFLKLKLYLYFKEND
jgi:hypothetical protein